MSTVRDVVERRRLVRRIRHLAKAERDHGHRAGVVQLGVMRTRLELYEQLAERVGDRRAPLPADGLAELSVLLEEEPPIRDYGPRAGERNERIATILAQLDGAVR